MLILFVDRLADTEAQHNNGDCPEDTKNDYARAVWTPADRPSTTGIEIEVSTFTPLCAVTRLSN